MEWRVADAAVPRQSQEWHSLALLTASASQYRIRDVSDLEDVLNELAVSGADHLDAGGTDGAVNTDTWLKHVEDQRLRWLRLTHLERLRWLDGAKRFVTLTRTKGAPEVPSPGSGSG